MWKAITSFLPGATTTPSVPPAKSFTSAAAAGPASVNSKSAASSTSASVKLPSVSLPSFTGNLKQNVNYTDPKDEETYNLKISKPKFNAGNSNPFFVNVPAKKYKVLVSDDPSVAPTEEITNSTLRFYGASAENVYKKAKTYKTSAKSKHNALFGKAQANYRTRITEKTQKASKNRNLLLKQREKQEAAFRSEIKKINKDLNELLTRLDFAKAKTIPATMTRKSRQMTNSEQARELRTIKQRIEDIPRQIESLQKEIAKVSGLPADIQTSLDGILKATKHASQLVRSGPVAPANIKLETKPANRNRLRAAASGAAGTPLPKQPTPTGKNSPRSTSSIEAGFGASAAAAKFKQGISGAKAKNTKAANAVPGASFLNPSDRVIPPVNASVAGRAAEAQAFVEGASGKKVGTNATNPPPPIRKPNEQVESPTGDTPMASVGTPVQANTAAVPNPKAAQPPPAPNSPWLGGTRRKQKKGKKASRKMKRGSRKH